LVFEIHSELLKLGINVSQASVAKYMVRPRKPPSQTWRTFLTNPVSQLVSTDFFTVHTISFEVLFVFVVLAHDRRRVLHFNVTAHPTAEWTAQQIVEAFPFDSAPKYLLRDRDTDTSSASNSKSWTSKKSLAPRGRRGNELTSSV
jgi:putative transposase